MDFIKHKLEHLQAKVKGHTNEIRIKNVHGSSRKAERFETEREREREREREMYVCMHIHIYIYIYIYIYVYMH